MVTFLILGLHDHAFESVEISGNYYIYYQNEKHEMCVCDKVKRINLIVVPLPIC
jgi:hypothetical protein